MGKFKDLNEQIIAQICALKESGLKTKEIATQVGVSERSVRRWVAKFHQGGRGDIPSQVKRSGRPKKTSN